MAGAPYAAGGINVTIEATRAASRRRAARRPRPRGWPRPAGPASRRSRSSPATAPPSTTRPGCCGIASRADATETTFLGAHVVPAEYVDRPTTTSPSSCGDDARRGARRTPAGSTPSASVGAFDADQCRHVLRPGATPGSGCACTPTSSGPGPGVQLAVELGCASADHCTYLSRRRRRRARRQRHRGHVPAGHRLLDPPALPRRPPGDRRRRHGRPGHELQPGVELHDVDVVRHRPRRARPAHDGRRGADRGHARRRPGPAPRRRRLARPRVTRRPRRARRARATTTSSTAPASRSSTATYVGGTRVICGIRGPLRAGPSRTYSGDSATRGRVSRSRRNAGVSPKTARAWRSGTRSRRRRARVVAVARAACCWACRQLGPEPLVLGLQLHHPADALEVHARLGELGDAPQHLDVGVAVAAVAALGAGRLRRARGARRCAASAGACRPARRPPRSRRRPGCGGGS